MLRFGAVSLIPVFDSSDFHTKNFNLLSKFWKLYVYIKFMKPDKRLCTLSKTRRGREELL